MNQQNKLADRIIEERVGWRDDGGRLGVFLNGADMDLIVAALRAAGGAEPVAWRRRRKGTIGNDGWIMCPLKPERDSEFELQALGVIGTASHPAPAESVREAVIPNVVLTFTARVDRDWFVHSRIETHKSSFNLAVAALIVLKAEIQKQIDSRSVCPAYREAATPLPQAAEKAAETVAKTAAVEFVSIRREWLEHVISVLQGDLPSGHIGDAVFLLREQFRDILDRDAPTEPSPSSPIMQTASAAETVAEPKNLPDNWDYMKNTNSVRCGGCLFRFGAEHPDSDGKWTCLNCGDGNGKKEAAAEPTRVPR